MAQHDYVIANGTGAAVRSDLNNGLSAIVTQNSGATEPTTTYAYMRWADTTAGVMKMRNGANSAWITLYQLDGEWSTIAFENGTAAAPSIYFKDSGTDTGFYSPGANQVGISTGGTARLTIDSNGNVDIDSNTLYVDATNNRVGLGTSSVSANIDIVGTSSTSANNTITDAAVRVRSNASGTENFAIRHRGGSAGISGLSSTCQLIGSGTNAIELYTVDATPLVFGTAATERMRLTSTGLGIGTTGPDSLLHIQAASDARLRIKATGSGIGVNSTINLETASEGHWVIQSGNAVSSGLRFYDVTNSTERARIDSSGRLLVGTSSARANLYNSNITAQAQLEGTTYDTSSALLTCNSTSATGAFPILSFAKSAGSSIGSNTLVSSGHCLGLIGFLGNDGTEFVSGAEIQAVVDGTSGANDMPTRLVFSTTADGASSPTERMRISNAGNVYIANTNDTPVQSNTAGAFTYRSSAQLEVNGNGTQAAFFGRTNDGMVVGFYSGGTRRGDVSISGSTCSFNNTSDYRLKENIAEITDASVRLAQLKPCRFNFIDEPNKIVDGFLAHEAQAVVPECATGTRDEVDDEGNPVYQGIDQSKLVPLLTAALQEALAEIESLKARVTALEP